MAKTVNPTHVIGERGAIRLADYCNQHEPYMIFRPVTVNDFGIDGEIELTELNADNKTTPNAQIIKVQIKSTAKDNSYIKKETAVSFEFHAKPDDIEYWEKYRQYGIKVLIVIFDNRENKLYCKEISNVDIANAMPKKGKQSYPIEFSKIDNLLEWGKHNFTEQYSKSFSGRVKQDVEETLITNLYPYKSFPRLLYSYKSLYTDIRKIWTLIDSNESPYFTIYGNKIYTFSEIEKGFSKFKEVILDSSLEKEQYTWNQILAELNLKNIYIELINQYIKDFMGRKGLKYNRHFNRYFFKLQESELQRKAKYRTRKREQLGEITVVKQYSYSKDTFFRHHAVELKNIFIEDRLHLLLNHQWFFTNDRKTPIESDLIAKYSIGINNELHNKELMDLQHFWYSFLAWNHENKSDNEMIIFDGKLVNQANIIVSRAFKAVVSFGIPTDGEKDLGKKKQIINQLKAEQLPLF